jgi:hypothetical protein
MFLANLYLLMRDDLDRIQPYSRLPENKKEIAFSWDWLSAAYPSLEVGDRDPFLVVDDHYLYKDLIILK